MAEKYQEYCGYRLNERKTPSEIARIMNVSTGMTYKWDKKFSKEYPEEHASLRTKQSIGAKNAAIERKKKRDLSEIESLRLKVEDLTIKLAMESEKKVFESPEAVPIPNHVSTIEKGQIAEDLVCYELRRRGFEVHRPWCVTGGTDWFLVDCNDRMIRLEVKSAYSGDGSTLRAKRSVMKDNKWTQRSYHGCKVDFFILVDLRHESIFIVPAVEIIDGKNCHLHKNGNMWKYKDAYDILHDAVNSGLEQKSF